MLNPTQAIADAIIMATQNDPIAPEHVQVQLATHPEYGQFQSNVALLLSKPCKDAPMNIAERLAASLKHHPLFESIIVTKPGFLNFTLAKHYLSDALNQLAADPRLGVPLNDHPERVVVDYSSPNIAKNMHIGHLRSTIIGDAISRLLTFCGDEVIRQNHIGDWGTQFGMLIEHLIQLALNPEETDLNDAYQTAKKRFDQEPDFALAAKKRVVALQDHEPETYALWQTLVRISEKHFSDVYQQLGILLDEADIRAESFYNPHLQPLVAQLEKTGVCVDDQGAKVIFLDEFKDRDGKCLPMIIQKTDGGFLYATTDLAALDFRLNQLKADRVIYVVDARQAQHLSMLFAAGEKIGWVNDQHQLDQALFGMVLGEDNKPFKTREGNAVALSTLVDEAIDRAYQMLKERHPDWDETQLKQTAKAIAVGALKYVDLSNDRIKNYVFSFERMLALDGNTAPYLQNAYVRIQSILRKAKAQDLQPMPDSIAVETDIEIKLACHIALFPKEICTLRDQLALHRLCHYLFRLAGLFHQFYEHHPILADTPQRASRLLLASLTANILAQGLTILGIEPIQYM